MGKHQSFEILAWTCLVAGAALGCSGSLSNDGSGGSGGSQAGGAGAPVSSADAGGDDSQAVGGAGGNGDTTAGGASNEAGSAGEAGARSEPGTPPAVWDHPWDVVMHTINHASMTADLCDGLTFTLAFPTVAGAPRAVASRDGEADDLKLYRQADGSLFQAPSQTAFLPISTACSIAFLSLSNLTLQLVDGKLVGAASGTAQHIMNSDVYQPQYPVDISFTGTTDSTAPAFNTPTTALSPLDFVSFSASEALASAEVALTSASAPIPLAFSGLDFGTGYFADVQLSTDQVLPFSGSWVLAGSGADFAGHALQLGQTITTLADPGVAAQDGFEGTLLALLSGSGAKLTDSTFAIPPISGSHSLLVQSGTSATLHFTRTTSQTTLSFEVVDLIPGGAQSITQQNGGIAAVIGGTHRAYLSWPVTGSTAITSTTWATASNPALVQVPLTDVGTDVVVLLSAAGPSIGPFGTSGPLYPTHSLLIDDVHLQ